MGEKEKVRQLLWKALAPAFKAVLGRGDGVIDVAGKPGYVWARKLGREELLITAFNRSGATVEGTTVLVRPRTLEGLSEYEIVDLYEAYQVSDVVNATQLQGRNISTVAPTAAEVLTWNEGALEWQGQAAGAPGAHAPSHQDGGADEISVAALSGLLADDQHVLDAEVLAVAAALVHAARHQNGGADEINVGGLDGVLADEQDAGWIKGKVVDDAAIADNRILVYDLATGTLKYENQAAAGIPGGADTQVQFNDAGAFGGDAAFTYNKTEDYLRLDGQSNDHANLKMTKAVAPSGDRMGAAELVITRDGGNPQGSFWNEYRVTAALDTGFDITIVNMAVAADMDGGSLLSEWLVSASPRADTGNWAVGGAEVNPMERFADAGKQYAPGAKWTYGISIVPENSLNLGDGAPVGFNITYGLVFMAGGTGGLVRTHIPIYFAERSIVTGGTGICMIGGTSSGDDPAWGMEFRGDFDKGIDFGNATLNSVNQEAMKLAAAQSVVFGSVPVYGDATKVSVGGDLYVNNELGVGVAPSAVYAAYIQYAGVPTKIETLGAGDIGQWFDSGVLRAAVLNVGDWWSASDLRLKEAIEDIDGQEALDALLQLRPIEFDWKLRGQHSVGFVAQELAEVIPLAASKSNDGLWGISSQRLIPYIVGAIGQLDSQLKELKR